MDDTLDEAAFIRACLAPAPVPGVPEVSIHTAHAGSGLRRLAEINDGAAPYWAYAWGGGAVLARHVLDHPEIVAGKRVLDLGAGSGLVGIAAALAGAAAVEATEIDPFGRAAVGLNAGINGVTISIVEGDVTGRAPAQVDLILAGDVFYLPEVAAVMVPFLDACLEAGIAMLVGDPGRKPLPVERLRAIAEYMVPDFGDPSPKQASRVFAWTSRPTK